MCNDIRWPMSHKIPRYKEFNHFPMTSKKSALFLVILHLSLKNSIASIDDIGPSMRRKIQIFCNMALSLMSSSSFLVPDLFTSIAGNILLSEILRSSTNSELPVPLNSSKMTSSLHDFQYFSAYDQEEVFH